jgi:NAD+ diphosphatase
VPGHPFRPLRSLFGVAGEAFLAVAGRARQIAEGDRTHRFCNACGAPTARRATGHVRLCTACGHTAWRGA